MIASVQLPNDDAQFDASHYDSEKGGRNLKSERKNNVWIIFFISLKYHEKSVKFDKLACQVSNKILSFGKPGFAVQILSVRRATS